MDQRFGTVIHGFSAAVSDEDIDSLRNDPDVESVVQDQYVHQLGTETGMGWALDRVDQKLMPLNGAFAYGATGAGVNIYVVDGGVRYTHTEFGGRAKFAYDALGGDGSDCNGHGTGVSGIAAGSVHGVAKASHDLVGSRLPVQRHVDALHHSRRRGLGHRESQVTRGRESELGRCCCANPGYGR
jgi:subtilisin family serine protease